MRRFLRALFTIAVPVALAAGLATTVGAAPTVRDPMCRAAAPMLDTNLPPVPMNSGPSPSTDIRHAVAVSAQGSFLAYIYVRQDRHIYYQDGYINGPAVADDPRSKLMMAAGLETGLKEDGPRSRGIEYPITPESIVSIISAGFVLNTCY